MPTRPRSADAGIANYRPGDHREAPSHLTAAGWKVIHAMVKANLLRATAAADTQEPVFERR
ncbi:MAG: hypothetical protein ACUVRC_04500 [Desulfotomaculales bacterium]